MLDTYIVTIIPLTNPTLHFTDFWIFVPDTMTSPITFTSYVTKITKSVGTLEYTSLEYLDEVRPVVGEDHFMHAHLLRVGRSQYNTLDETTQIFERRTQIPVSS